MVTPASWGGAASKSIDSNGLTHLQDSISMSSIEHDVLPLTSSDGAGAAGGGGGGFPSRGGVSAAQQQQQENDRLTVLVAGHTFHAHMRMDMSRQELLHICRDAAPFREWAAAGEGGHGRAVGSVVALRDMFVVQSKSEPTILVRRGVILVSLEPLKAIVTADHLYVLVQPGADEILEPIKVRLHNAATQQAEGKRAEGKIGQLGAAFEFAALEVIFMSAAAIKRRQAEETVAEAREVLRGVRHSLSSRLLSRVLRLKKRLVQVLSEVNGCRDAFEEVQEEEQMALMYLTALKANPAVFDARLRHSSWNTDEVEMLLDSYEQEMAAMSRQLKLLDAEIEATEALLKLKLDTARNNLIKVDVSFGVAALWLTAASLISGLCVCVCDV